MGEVGQRISAVDSSASGGTQEIRVDASTLRAFANTLRGDFDRGVAPVATRVQLAFANGAIVGANNPSNDLHTMLEAYDNCLEAMSQQLCAYAEFADMLTTAAHTIVARYTTSDQLSGASALAVESAFNQASPGMNAMPSAIPEEGMTL